MITDDYPLCPIVPLHHYIILFVTDECDTRADLVAVGLWTDISVRVLKLPSCEQLFVEMLGGGQFPSVQVDILDYLHGISLQRRCYFRIEWLINQVFTVAILDCNWMLDQ